MFPGSDGLWLAAVNCFGDICIYSLETQRHCWFISRLGGASVTAGGFSPTKYLYLMWKEKNWMNGLTEIPSHF
ncbi:hypothetical protein MLD38_002034 [Melastoma candidum]|uniref:Uncharacterized protein n=1 Tax=Melastoma candidum TaxID=119954 RepID=A0ACB9SF86_9MYRT|nr:hypothetical protein MLD38_002034 [Melastoma candidum]